MISDAVLVPDLMIDADGVRRGVSVRIKDGTIFAVFPASEAPTDALHLSGRALLPGFVNVHSHAFQRCIRGVVERLPSPGTDDDFWSWREAMYAAVERLDPELIGAVSRRCFSEMRHAGFTTVGEFHYVHHDHGGVPHMDANAMAKAVCEAAETVGLRIVLLLAAYERGGHRQELVSAQRRFVDTSVDEFLGRLDELVVWAAERPLVQIGVAPHSVRACSLGWLTAIAEHCSGRMPIHIHADEQPREVDECLEEHGLRPVELISEVGLLGPLSTIVHATHADASELALIASSGATVCVCPTTEANLGDGFAPVERILRQNVRLAIGTDSNTRIDPLEEARELELIARRTALRRNVLVRQGDAGPADLLLNVLWSWGAESLGLPAPRIAPGAPADLVTLNLTAPELADVNDEELAPALLFSGSRYMIEPLCVAGEMHPDSMA